MAGDGEARISDFGIAVAVDVSRLTQTDMMVGTASYMPPEQAMSSEITLKSCKTLSTVGIQMGASTIPVTLT